MIRLVLVDDQTLVRQGLRRLLDYTPDVQVVDEAGDGLAAVEEVRQTRPDALLLDVRLPRLDGVGVLRALGERGELPPALMLTAFNADEALTRSWRAGARGFVLKDVTLEQLLADIRAVLAGATVLRAGQHRLLRGEDLPAGAPLLTERETQVLRLLAAGHAHKVIARLLDLSGGTVNNHVSVILQKLGVRDRIRAALLAVERHLV